MRYTKLYKVWLSMKQRCLNPKDAAFKNYGGRGIDVCEMWREDFRAYSDWAYANGYSESLLLSIDRIDNNKGYSPDNCKLSTRKEQNTNRRGVTLYSYDSECRCVADWANILGVTEFKMTYWLKKFNYDSQKTINYIKNGAM
jgi:hypothetical protein